MRFRSVAGWGLTIGCLSLVTGCMGDELLHRFTFSPEAIEAQQTSLSLRKGERLQFWNSLDVSYQKGTELTFKIEVKPDNRKEKSTVICDALNPSLTIMSATVERNSSISKSWKGADELQFWSSLGNPNRLHHCIASRLRAGSSQAFDP